jgi:hypothetical protein
MELKFSGQTLEKFSNTKCHENLSGGGSCSTRADLRMDRHDEGNSHFSQFLNAPNGYSKNWTLPRGLIHLAQNLDEWHVDLLIDCGGEYSGSKQC